MAGRTFAATTAGATAGAPFGPIGAAIGAGIGGLAGLINHSIERSRQKKAMRRAGSNQIIPGQTGIEGLNTVSNLTPQQQQLQNESIRQALSLLQGGNPQNFEPIADQARSNFASKTVPLLAERFGGAGMERGSSALTGQLGGAGAELERGLAALQAQYGQSQLQQLLGAGLKNSTDFVRQQGSPGLFEMLSGQLAQVAPQLFNSYYGSQNQSQSPASGLTPGYDFGAGLLALQNARNNTFLNTYGQGLSNMPGYAGYNYGQMPSFNQTVKFNNLGGGY